MYIYTYIYIYIHIGLTRGTPRVNPNPNSLHEPPTNAQVPFGSAAHNMRYGTLAAKTTAFYSQLARFMNVRTLHM